MTKKRDDEEAMVSSPPDNSAPESSSDVHRLEVGGREFILVGTAHISQQSVDLVRKIVEEETPDCVCIELDAQRYEALSQASRFEALNLREVIRKQQLAALLMNLLLASYQKRLGMQLGVNPGSELLEAAIVAKDHGIPIALCDRDIRVTLRRAWHALPWYRKLWLTSSIMASAFDSPELDEEELARIRQQDVLTELMSELGEQMPDLKHALIDERDSFLAEKIRTSKGQKIVAVVGAGHVRGMLQSLESREHVDLDSLNVIPKVSPFWKWFGWAIPAIIVSSIAYIGWTQGSDAAGDNALYWFLANAIPTGIGGIIAMGHPVTTVAAFMSAPFTSLTPLIGAGYVAAGVQAWLAPPIVSEFQSVGDDIASWSAWWKSRLLRIFLVFLLTTIGSMVGTWVGGYEIVSNLFS
jgi:pheromone shutdown-related protein TraB